MSPVRAADPPMPVRSRRDLAVEEVAAVVAAAAIAAADLHEAGGAHGALGVDTVLLAADGRVVLAPPQPGASPDDDLAALPVLLRCLLDRCQPSDLPALPWWRRLERSESVADGASALPWALPHRRWRVARPDPMTALRRLAARADDPKLAPLGARGFAAAVLERVPSARLPQAPRSRPDGSPVGPAAGTRVTDGRAPDERPADDRPADDRRADDWPAVGSAVDRRARRGPGLDAQPADDRPADDRPAVGSPVDRLAGRGPGLDARPPARPPAGRGGPAPALAVIAIAAVAIGGIAFTITRLVQPPPRPQVGRAVPAAPATTAAYQDGVLTVDGASFTVGQPGDVVATADWTCTGQPTVALLRPGTGELFVFDRWADAAGDATARRTGRVDHAVGIRPVDPDGDGCPAIEVARDGLTPQVVAATTPPTNGAQR